MPKKGYKQTPEAIKNRIASHIGWRKSDKKGWIHNGRKFIQDGDREILEHRYIMEQHIGRRLERSEVVHHINGDILDNRIENLQLMTRGQHVTLHDTGKIRKGNRHPPPTDEQRKRISEAAKGRKRPSQETRDKISASMKRVRREKSNNSHSMK
jgi:hypothetical protein